MGEVVSGLWSLHPVAIALIAGLAVWSMTALGSAGVFFVRSDSRYNEPIFFGFAAGVMIAAAVFSLVLPALAAVRSEWFRPEIVVATAIVAGATTISALDYFVIARRSRRRPNADRGVSRRSLLMVAAITLHNVPEALALGAAFSAVSLEAAAGVAGNSMHGSAVALMIAIGLHNIPEGAVVSLPALAEGSSPRRAFGLGVLSGAVEPFAAVIGAVAVIFSITALPYLLAFAAGAMLIVTIQEIVPQKPEADTRRSAIGAAAFVGGFVAMLVLAYAL